MSTLLPCGTSPDVLLSQVAEGRGGERDSHQGGCPHCQATLAEYARLWAPFNELAATPTPAPRAVMDRALAAIREKTDPPGWGRVDDDGATFLVAARAVVTVAGHAARGSAGVRMALGALGRLHDAAPDETSSDGDTDSDAAVAPSRARQPSTVPVAAGVTGQSVAVDLRVAAEYGHDLHVLAAHLRERVMAEVRAQTGLEVVEVDVAITDVFAARTD